MARPFDGVFRRLEALPVGVGAAIGVAAGGAAGATLLVEPTWWRLVALAALGAAAVPLAYFARPVAAKVVVQKLTAPEPIPARKPGLLEMMPIPAGSFGMGSREDDPRASDDEKPRHRVGVAAFEMGKYAVTQEEYRAVMGDNPGTPQGDKLPVTNVSWFDAAAFCNALSQREGLAPAYTIEGTNVTWNEQADGYRLPTEAEWEYAARAGTETAWSFGDEETKLADYAWYGESFQGNVHPVGQKLPNPWGLYDMHGNVWEWCWEVVGPYLEPLPASGARVLRGGSFIFNPGHLRSVNRFWHPPEDRNRHVGFRCARGVRRRL